MSILGTRVVRTEDPAVPHPRRASTPTTSRRAAGRRAARSRSSARPSRTPGSLAIDAAAARSAPGVVAVVHRRRRRPRAAAAAVRRASTRRWCGRCWPTDVVRFVGEPVAVVLTEERLPGRGRRRAGRRRLRPAAGRRRPRRPPPRDEVLLFPEAGTNTVARLRPRRALDRGPLRRLRGRRHRRRSSTSGSPPAPLETRAAAAAWGEDGRLTAVVLQPGRAGHARRGRRAGSASTPSSVRVITPDVGGGFGAKIGADPEYALVAWLAKQVGRPGALGRDPLGEPGRDAARPRPSCQTVTIGGSRDGTVARLPPRRPRRTPAPTRGSARCCRRSPC